MLSNMQSIALLALYGVIYYSVITILRTLNDVYERRRQQAHRRREMRWWTAKLHR